MELLNQQVMKAKNMKAAFSLIWNEPGISRAEIAKRLSLSKTTISSLVEELISRSFIVDTGKQVAKAVGRRPSSLFVEEKSHFVPVVTWSRNTIAFHVIDLNGNTVFAQSEQILDSGEFLPVTKKRLKAICDRKAFKDKILGCCLVLPGMIDSSHNVLYSTTLGIFDVEADVIYEEVHKACRQYPLAILQDTACYAYAEKIYTDILVQDFAFINFNLGIGASLFVEGKMLGKANGAFTQLGHYSIDPHGVSCACGNRGCLENEIGECNLSKRFKEFADTVEEVPSYLSYEDLGLAIGKGNEAAKKVVISLASDFAQVLRNVVCIINPRLIVLGGKCQNLGDFFLSQVQSSLHEQGFSQMSDYTLIRYTSLDSNSYLKGAMRYFFDTYYDFSDTSDNALYIG